MKAIRGIRKRLHHKLQDRTRVACDLDVIERALVASSLFVDSSAASSRTSSLCYARMSDDKAFCKPRERVVGLENSLGLKVTMSSAVVGR